MEYRRLGQTDLKISRIGFGCWAIGGYGWGRVDDNVSVRAMRRAMDMGVNLFDTADVYGLGHSEEVLSKGLGKDIDRVVVATKFGVTWDENKNISRDISPSRVRKALEGSLRRLGTDCISLYQIHWPDGRTEIEDTMDELLKCRDEGKIQYIGCSNFDGQLIDRAQNRGRIESSQFPYSLIRRDAERTYLPLCEKWKMSALVYGSIEKGLLTGKFDETSSIDDNDVRSKDPNFSINFKRNLQIVEHLRLIGQHYNKTPAQIAIRWVLDQKGVVAAIIGIKNINQVVDNCGSLEWTLDLADAGYLSQVASL